MSTKTLGHWYYRVDRIDNRGDDPCMQLTFTAEVLAKNLTQRRHIKILYRQLRRQLRQSLQEAK